MRVARAAMVCPSGFLSHSEAVTHRAHTHCAHGLQPSTQERCTIKALHFLPAVVYVVGRGERVSGL